jgi:SAM-dependent methyltransferase
MPGQTVGMGVEQLRLHEIVESGNVIINPLTSDQLDLLGRICRPRPGQRHLDLACGKGEMLCRWAHRYGTGGVGVDLSAIFLTAARARAVELGVTDRIDFVEADAAGYRAELEAFDLVSCLGATWIGDGLVGTLDLMRPALRQGGLILVGEPFWNEDPPPEALVALGLPEGLLTTLGGTAERLADAGYSLVEMVLASRQGWDRYVAPHWWAADTWAREHPDDPEAAAVLAFAADERDGHLRFGRRYLGWGVFVLRTVFDLRSPDPPEGWTFFR